MHYLSEQNILLFLVQVFLLLGMARLAGGFLRRMGQPSLIGEILVGIVLGPTILGRLAPGLHMSLFPVDQVQQSMLETVAWIGLLFFLLETGLELDFSSAWRQRGDALKIALADLIIPMVIAFVPCLFLPAHYIGTTGGRISFCLFMAAVMTISALPATARVLQDLHLYKTNLGFLIMCALSVNDLLGWVLFTLILGFLTKAEVQVGDVALILAATLGFTAVCLTLGRRFSDKVIARSKSLGLPEPGTSLTFIVLLGLLCGAITTSIGIHALFGFFTAGIMVGEAKALSERTRMVISQMVHAIFVPLFFTSIGLKIDMLKSFDIFLAVFLLVLGTVGRYVGAWIGVGLTKHPRTNRDLISIAHVPGGEMQIVVGLLALEFGLLTETVFVCVIFGAITSTALLGPWMSAAMKKRKTIHILEYFSRDAIHDIAATTRDAAIAELAAVAAEARNVNDHAVVNALMAREREFGTAVEMGIAVPHARLAEIRSPVHILGRSEPGIEWNSPDGRLTRLVFMILTPAKESQIQLHSLGILARALAPEDVRARLLAAKTKQEIWTVLEDVLRSGHIDRAVRTPSANPPAGRSAP